MNRCSVLADVGGTNVRFAWVGDDTVLNGVKRVPNTTFKNFSDALHAYLTQMHLERVDALRIAAAGPTLQPWNRVSLRRNSVGAQLR